jgi:nitrate reductase NapAB chaperone NapD
MVITGSALFIEPGTFETVREKLKAFAQVTYHVCSDSGTELVVNIEADNHNALEELCTELKAEIPEIVDITHIYVNFEEEVEKLKRGKRPDGPPPSLDEV